METILYLIRHGETEWNNLRRIQGHSNIELNQVGYSQAEKLAARFSASSFHAIYSSDLLRAHDTAQRLARKVGIPVRTLSSLRERCYGQWEGLTYDEISAIRSQKTDESQFGVESASAMQERAHAALTELAKDHSHETIAVVSHGGFINSFLHRVTSGAQGTGITKIDNTSVSVFRYSENGWDVITINDTDHL